MKRALPALILLLFLVACGTTAAVTEVKDTAHAWRVLADRLSDLVDLLKERFLPVLEKLTDGLAHITEGTTSFLDKVWPAVLAAIVGGGGVAAVHGRRQRKRPGG